MSDNKRALVIRYGAYGDMIIISPVIEQLKKLGYYIILNTTARGEEVFRYDSRIDKFIMHDSSISLEKLPEHWDKLKKETPHDYFVNFSESLECNVALHPRDPLYIYPKPERYDRCNHSYYDVTTNWAKLTGCSKLPTLYFSEEEEIDIIEFIKPEMFNILWCLSGSGKNKVYPWTDYVIGETIKKHPGAHFITVGNEKCQILEDINKEFPIDNITQLSGKISIRQSMLLTKYVDLVISPDTGILHASGCYDTSKIGLLGHTTIENITKYFTNDYSIEANCACAPCFRLIYDWEIQCPIDHLTRAAYCMASIKPEQVFDKIDQVITKESLNKQAIHV